MIMDGNRRWAKEKKFQALTVGHKKGVDSIKESVRFCLKNNIKYLSLYAFSLENFRRSETEKSYLFNLLNQHKKDLTDLVKEDVKVSFVGDKSLFPESVLETIDEVEGKTKDCDKLHLNFLFCYGSQQEVLSAVKKIAHKVRSGELDVDDIDIKSFKTSFGTAVAVFIYVIVILFNLLSSNKIDEGRNITKNNIPASLISWTEPENGTEIYYIDIGII